MEKPLNDSVRDFTKLEDYQKRVVDEKSELSEKLIKLSEFIQSENFEKLSDTDKSDLKSQYLFMSLYFDKLSERINRFFDKSERVKTLGEKTIGTFGTDKWEVFEIKKLSETLIDTIQRVYGEPRRKAIAITKIEEAQMMAVKSLFT